MSNCNSIIPSICGSGGAPHIYDAGCGSVYFVGISDTTIYVGDTIDLSEGVHAYDANGNEITYTYSPTEIDTSEIGTYTVTYKASGVSTNARPTLVCGKDAVHIADCEYGTTIETRIITVQAQVAVVCEAKVCQSKTACKEPSHHDVIV